MIFQQTMEVILSPAECQYGLVYLDHIAIFSECVYDHMVHLRQVPTLWQDAGGTLKIEKYSISAQKMNHLFRVVRPKRLKLCNATGAAVYEIRARKNQRELRSFLCLRNLFRCFNPNLSKVAAPLNIKPEINQRTFFPNTFSTKRV